MSETIQRHWIELSTFLLLVLVALLRSSERLRLLSRQSDEWVIDLFGLIHQGWIVPILQTVLIYRACFYFWPAGHGIWNLPSWAAFTLNFVGVDYLYYWNHRVLHTRLGWRIHRIHHSATSLDLLVSSRNTALAPFFIVYLWANGVLAYLLASPSAFLLSASLTAALDLWRHSSLMPTSRSPFKRVLSGILTFPVDHHAHHGHGTGRNNYGANLMVWDRLHGTHLSCDDFPTRYGERFEGTFFRRLLIP